VGAGRTVLATCIVCVHLIRTGLVSQIVYADGAIDGRAVYGPRTRDCCSHSANIAPHLLLHQVTPLTGATEERHCPWAIGCIGLTATLHAPSSWNWLHATHDEVCTV
jgi:hypothetical protein